MWALRKTSGTIAIVDDDEAILDSIQLVLAEVYWTVRTYDSGEAFLLDLTELPPPDCLILDPHLRGMDGGAVARVVSDSHANLPIIGLTARPYSPLAAELRQAGAHVILTKPVTVETLVEHVEVALTAGRK